MTTVSAPPLPPVGGVGGGGVGEGLGPPPPPPHRPGLHAPQTLGNSLLQTVVQACCSDMPLFFLSQSIRAPTLCPLASLFRTEEVQELQPHEPPLLGGEGLGPPPPPPHWLGLHAPQTLGNSLLQTTVQACCSDIPLLDLSQSIRAPTLCPFAFLFKTEAEQEEHPHLDDCNDR